MHNLLTRHRPFVRSILVFIITAFFAASVQAAMVSTDRLIADESLKQQRSDLMHSLDRDEVRRLLVDYGVDPDKAKQRIASLTAEEIQTLQTQVDELPAGGGVLELALTIILILIITDILGLTDVFPRI